MNIASAPGTGCVGCGGETRVETNRTRNWKVLPDLTGKHNRDILNLTTVLKLALLVMSSSCEAEKNLSKLSLKRNLDQLG